jgi:hypothetical protein
MNSKAWVRGRKFASLENLNKPEMGLSPVALFILTYSLFLPGDSEEEQVLGGS